MTKQELERELNFIRAERRKLDEMMSRKDSVFDFQAIVLFFVGAAMAAGVFYAMGVFGRT